MTATSERIAAVCTLSTDGTGEHCDCWFNPRNGGDEGADPCCFCEGEPYCVRIEDDEPRRDWEYADANGGGW